MKHLHEQTEDNYRFIWLTAFAIASTKMLLDPLSMTNPHTRGYTAKNIADSAVKDFIASEGL